MLIVISSDLFVRDPDITAPLAYVTRQRVCQDGSMSGENLENVRNDKVLRCGSVASHRF
jgi:hypothetical protein